MQNPEPAASELEELRSHLDRIDEALLDLIADRLRTCLRVAEYKKANDVPMMQPHRIRVAHERAERFAAEQGLSAEFLHALYDAIIAEACRVETVAMEGAAA
jgi:chorismate mutase